MSGDLAYQDDLQEKRRVETIGGEVVAMSPRPAWNHNRVSSNIFRIFDNYLYGKECTPIADGTDLFLDDDDRFVPDFMVVCDTDKIRPDGVHGTPDLVVEVLSPSTAKNDRTRKLEAYARCGVREYWIVDPSSKIIEIYRSDGTGFVLHDVYALHPDWQIAQMSEEERAARITHFKCSLFDDLEIPLEGVFYRTI